MKTKTATKHRKLTVGLSAETRETLKRLKERHAKFLRLSKAEQLADLIRRGAFTPEGKLPVYPMDQVPWGRGSSHCLPA